MTTNGEMPMKMGISAPRVVISDYPADALLELRLRPEVDRCNSGTSSRPGVHPTIGLNGADIAIEERFYPTTRDDSEMTADAFSLLGGGVSASAVTNPATAQSQQTALEIACHSVREFIGMFIEG
jgi:hypothetical protein